MLWCSLCPWTLIFKPSDTCLDFITFVCLWQLLVRFDISPFYQHFLCGSQIGFAYKSNAFTVVVGATIIKPMPLQLYFQKIQKYKSCISTFWNETISKIQKMVSFQKEQYKTYGFGTPFVITAKILRLYKQSVEWNHFKNPWSGFISKKHYKTDAFGTPFLYGQRSKCFISKVWNESISKINKVVSFQRNIRKPMVCEHLVLYMQTSSGLISKVRNETNSKIHKMVSFQRNITKAMLSTNSFSI